MTRRFGAWCAALVVAFALGAAAARGVLERAPPAIARDLAQPLPVVTSWGAYGAWCFATLALAIVLATLALVAVLRAIPRDGLAHGVGAGAVVAFAALALAAAACFPFTFSSDPYAYAAYGEMAARGLDPYALVAPNVHGTSIDAARYQWGGRYPVCVYGPAFVAFARALWSATTPFGPAATVAAFRLCASLAFLASIALLDAALAGLAPQRRLAIVCAYGLDPVLLWSVAEGHNDAGVLLVASGAAVLARRGRAFAAGAFVGLAALVKAPGALLAAAYALDAAYVARPRALVGIARRPGAVAGVALGLTVAAVFAIPPLLPALAEVGAHGTYEPTVSLQALTGPVIAAGLAFLALAYALVRIARGDRDGFAWLGLAAVAALPNVYPWYALWLVPFALAAGPGGASRALYGVTLCAVIRYLPDAAGNMTVGIVRIASVGAMLPIVLAFTRAPRKKVVAPL